MPLHTHIDEDTRLLVTFVPGSARSDEIIKNVEQVVTNRSLAEFNDLTIFEDLNRNVGSLKISGNGLKTVAELLSREYGHRGKYRSAYVVASQVDYGLMRMYTTYRGRDLESFSLFLNVSDALEWFDLPTEQVERLLKVIAALCRNHSADDEPT